jgi:hypothetical protein
VAKEEAAGENAVDAERRHIEAVLGTVIVFLNERDGLDNAGQMRVQVPDGLTVGDIRDELHRILSKNPGATSEEVRHRLSRWALQQLQIGQVLTHRDSADTADLAAQIKTGVNLHGQRLYDVRLIGDHFKLEDNVEAELMAVRVAAFFVDALKQGQRIILRSKDGKESEVVFEPESGAGEKESSAHG